MGWQPFMHTWLVTLCNEQFDNNTKHALEHLFNTVVPIVLEWLERA